MRICLMIEGQEGVTWKDWVALARTCEEAGIEALFRSDHYVSMTGETRLGSLDAWATICGLGALTERVRLGTMVSPATFRHPSVLAKMVATADHISGGRIELGMGAGWFEGEHDSYGFDFPATNERMQILAEQLEIVHGQWSEDEFNFDGAYYSLDAVHALPKPVQRPHPPLIIGGSGGAKTLELTARWADEYNHLFATVADTRRTRTALDERLRAHGRDPGGFTLSLMTTCIVGTDEDDLRRRVRNVLEHTNDGRDPDDYIAAAAEDRLVGTVDHLVERLLAYEAVGVSRAMLQHLHHTDLAMVRLIGDELVPTVS